MSINQEKNNIIGWSMAFIAFVAQLITIVWTIATMNASIVILNTQMHELVETMKTISVQVQSNSTDIKILQQNTKK